MTLSREILILSLILTVLPSIVNGQNALNDGLIHYFPFLGNLQNVIDPTKPATLSTGAVVSNSPDRFGQVDRALQMDASRNQVLILPNETMDGLNSFTVTMWSRTNDLGQNTQLLSVANSGDTNEVFITRTSFRLKHTDFDNYSSIFTDTTSWVHIAMVRDQPNALLTLYLDGVQHSQINTVNNGAIVAEGVVIGNDQDSVLGNWDINSQLSGSFQEYRFYNQVKTISEINIIKEYIRCYNGEYSVVNVGCLPCRERYNTCSAVDVPLSCKGNNRKGLLDDCLCLDHFFEDPATEHCIECRERYGNCSDLNTPINCQGNNRKSIGDDCVCQDGFYEDPLSIDCLECRERYETCSAENIPISCQGINRKPLGGDCLCLDHFYEDPHSINCTQCRERYGNCSAVDSPITCQGTNRKSTGDDCLCLDHYYEDPLTINCLECRERYGNCSAQDTPTTCQGTNRKSVGDDCICLDHYYEDSLTINCLECRERYGNCSDETTPLSCDGNNRKSTGDDCVCLDHYYEDPFSINCIECRERYGNCSAEDTPTTCQGTNRKAVGDDCLCLDHFFEDPLTINCLECRERYGNCIDETTPQTCNGNNRKSPGDDCVCLDHFYQDLLSINCLECPNRYGDCSDSSTPLSCQGNNRKFIGEDCVCEDGFYEDPDSINCIQCPSKFGLCTDINTPQSCQGLNRKGVPDLCECKDGYFENPNDNNCYGCQYPCPCNPTKCATCRNDPDDCLTLCHESCAQCDSQGKCTKCPLGSSLNDGICESCNSKCEICDQNNKNICHSCLSQREEGRSRNLIDNCSCLEGYFENSITLKCEKCLQQPCKKCDSDGKCIECIDSSFIPPNCELKKSGFQVIDLDDGNLTLNRCAIHCETCTEKLDHCSTCIKALNRMQEVPCKCMDGYHDNDGISRDCQKCPKQCALCNNDYSCLKCKENSGRKLSKFNQKCSCRSGYKENLEGECQKCYLYQGQWYEICPQNTLTNKEMFLCQDKNIELNSYMTYLVWVSFIIILIFVVSLNRQGVIKLKSIQTLHRKKYFIREAKQQQVN